MEIKTKFGIGDELKCKITGFKGVCLALTQYATGCTHYGLAPQKVGEDGKIGQYEWLDETMLTLAKKGKVEFEYFAETDGDDEYKPARAVGGAMPNAPQM